MPLRRQLVRHYVRLLPKLANAVRLQPPAPAYNLSNFLYTLATPDPIKDVDENAAGETDQDWREGRRPRAVCAFQMADVAVPGNLFTGVLQMIRELRAPP